MVFTQEQVNNEVPFGFDIKPLDNENDLARATESLNVHNSPSKLSTSSNEINDLAAAKKGKRAMLRSSSTDKFIKITHLLHQSCFAQKLPF